MANETYTVTGQAEVLDTSDLSKPVPAQRITFKSKANGTVGTITVPLSEFTPENVHDLISARVAAIDAVHEL